MANDQTPPLWADVFIRLVRSSVPFALGAWGFQSQINATSDRPYFLIACVFLMGLLPADIATALARRWASNGNGNGAKK
jgi:hypothetical protein